MNTIVYAPASGRLTALPFADVTSDVGLGVITDVSADVGQEVDGPDRIFSTGLVDIYVGAKSLRRARSLTEELLREPPIVTSVGTPGILEPVSLG